MCVPPQVFRREWQPGIHPVQWNAVQSEANVLRGVHVHVVQEDYFVLLKGGQTLPGAPRPSPWLAHRGRHGSAGVEGRPA